MIEEVIDERLKQHFVDIYCKHVGQAIRNAEAELRNNTHEILNPLLGVFAESYTVEEKGNKITIQLKGEK